MTIRSRRLVGFQATVFGNYNVGTVPAGKTWRVKYARLFAPGSGPMTAFVDWRPIGGSPTLTYFKAQGIATKTGVETWEEVELAAGEGFNVSFSQGSHVNCVISGFEYPH